MIGIAPDAEYFAVNLTHKALPGNTVRFRARELDRACVPSP